MIENVVHDIGGVAIFGIISVCIFFGFFASVILWAGRLKKPYLNSMGDLPLDDSEHASQTKSETTEDFRHE
jgi:hypothetical protein